MKRFFNRKHKKLPKPLKEPISLTKPTIPAAGSSGIRTDQRADPKETDDGSDTCSPVVHQDEVSKPLTSVPAFGGTGGGNELTSKGTIDREPTEGFGSLKATLGTIPAVHANDNGVVAIGNKVENLLSHIVQLERYLDSRPDDVAELRRRNDLLSKLEAINVRLKSLAEIPVQLAQETSGLLDELQETMFGYQTVQQEITYGLRLKQINPAEAAILNSFRSAQGAEFRHGSRRGCLRGTRVAVLDEISLWARDFDKSPVYWLNGLAGTGKTTIAQTVAERLFAEGMLGASFFCSRDFEDRSDLHLIFPTLAVQLARNYTGFRSVFVPMAQSDPGISRESLYKQMSKLITDPLRESGTSTVIVIDALDECKDEETASAILSVLGRLVEEAPKVKFFLTGRPEPRIQTGFRLPLLRKATEVFVLHDVESRFVSNDIRLFFKRSFLEMAELRGDLDGWPTDEEVERLCELAAGLFVYAVATVKFVEKRGTSPRKQLDLLLQSPESSVREAKTKFRKDATIDSLYTSILQEAFDDENDPDNDLKVRSVLGAMLLAVNPLSPSTIATLLALDIGEVFPLLSSAQSLLILQEDIKNPVRPFHKSFPDFILDPARCIDQRFHVSAPHHHSRLLIGCLNLMSQTLEKNVCKLPDGVANSDVKDLEDRTERYINPALRYACRSWHTHLIGGHPSSADTLEIASALHRFLESKFLFWLEVLSVLDALRIAVDALQGARDWLEESPTLELASDCSRFVTQHIEVISASAPHIYHSALVITPRESIVRKLYESQAQPFVRVVQGVPALWDPSVTTVTTPSDTLLSGAVWSPCNRFIAIPSLVSVNILDSTTLQLFQHLEPPQETHVQPGALAFSPDTRMLTSLIYGHRDMGWFIVSWDLQTGGVLVGSIEWREPREFKLRFTRLTFSTSGKMVAILFVSDSSAIISIYDISSGVYIHEVHHGAHHPALGLKSLNWYKIWTHGESLRFSTPEPAGITTWEVRFTPGATPIKVETNSIPDNIFESFVGSPGLVGFHAPSSRLVIAKMKGPLLVWDVRASRYLLPSTSIDSSFSPISFSFSSDGHFFACPTSDREVSLWKESSNGYTIFQKFMTSDLYSTPLLSPNAESIIAIGSSIIQLWNTKTSTTTTSNILPRTIETSIWSFILEFLPDKPLAAIARVKGRTVTVLDLRSGTPQLTIDTPMEVCGLKPIGNTIVVIGNKTAITWNLPGGDLPPDTRMNAEDSTQTIHFSTGIQDISFVVAASISADSQYIVLQNGFNSLVVYWTSTSTIQVVQDSGWAVGLWFAPGTHDLWCATEDSGAKVFSITQDVWHHIKTVAGTEYGTWGCPWGSSCGYQVTNEGWVVCRDGKRLLMLPPLWRSMYEGERVWKEKFLALLLRTLPEPVILELEP